jgi:nitrogen fixation protein FixH
MFLGWFTLIGLFNFFDCLILMKLVVFNEAKDFCYCFLFFTGKNFA